ncbi:hypothetical protein [Lentilactobacillus sp. SPB1-3]|uniref:Uncharacterized protein n=1 Tax=Lentilactobacillus terminaliae TaxID=3003483 RepID=A0ACD5DE43_9LACO|nr:hypothetical protein [Lentilactobacillus sp. SPB1-3]MCZ0977564.1 hypothetical protein [Lentilactobacillus sp. SPB1-3]
MKNQYEVFQYIGVPVTTDDSGKYVIKRDDSGEFKLHSWRTGKHTKGKPKGIGQIFITENNMLVAVVKSIPVKFKDRHDYTPLQRFTSEFLDEQLVSEAQTKLSL